MVAVIMASLKMVKLALAIRLVEVTVDLLNHKKLKQNEKANQKTQPQQKNDFKS
jgi:hypothetical protein